MISYANISKDKSSSSEDSVKSGKLNHFVITVIADGNGSIGVSSRHYNKGGLRYSEIALTTETLVNRMYDHISKIINRMLEIRTEESKDLLSPLFELRSLRYVFKNGIQKIIPRVVGEVCCCLMLTVIDTHNRKFYCVSIGDCDYTIYNVKDKGNITPHAIKNLQDSSKIYKRSDCNYIAVPNSVIASNVSDFNIGTIETYESPLPEKYCVLVYSDGLSKEAYIPEEDIIEEIEGIILERNMNINARDFINKDPNVLVTTFNLLKYIEKYLVYVIRPEELLSIIETEINNGSKSIIKKIMLHTDESYKQDDRSISVFIN